MTQQTQSTVDLRNSSTECSYSTRKENEGEQFNHERLNSSYSQLHIYFLFLTLEVYF
jgi:hypothetical protein